MVELIFFYLKTRFFSITSYLNDITYILLGGNGSSGDVCTLSCSDNGNSLAANLGSIEKPENSSPLPKHRTVEPESSEASPEPSPSLSHR